VKTRVYLAKCGLLAASSLLASCLGSQEPKIANPSQQNASSRVTLNIEPSVPKGKVTAVYVSLEDTGPNPVVFLALTSIFYVISDKGVKVNEIGPEPAVVAAGGEKELAAGLIHMPRSHAAAEFATINVFLPWTSESQGLCDPATVSYSWIMCHGGAWAFLPIDLLIVGPVVAMSAPLSEALPDDANYHRRIEAGALHGPTLAPGYPHAGYVFFPSGTYRTIGIQLKDAVTQEQVTASAPWQ